VDRIPRPRLVAAAGALLLAIVVVRACAGGPLAPPRVPGTPVDVRLALGPALAPLDADGPVDLYLAPGETEPRRCEDLSALRFARGRLRLGDAPLEADEVLVDAHEGVTLAHDGRRYRGRLLLRVRGARGEAAAGGPGPPAPRVEVVNRLPVEQYLLGVLPVEVPDHFEEHARRAQAVAARTYALAEMAARGFVHDDTRSQVYGGLPAETRAGHRAVRATEGQVLVRAGAPVTAWFHSTCGGRTAPARAVFEDAPEGWLDGPVACPDCTHSPVYAWTRRVPAARLAEALGLTQAPRAVSTDVEAYPGRARRVTVTTASGRVQTDAAALRAALSRGRGLDEQLLSTLWTRPPRRDGDAFVFSGRGWGHGVGLCQYGADGYARRGANHVAILERYYPGARLVRRTDPAGADAASP